MASLQVETQLPELSPPESLTGWRLEFCIELLGDGAARLFMRKVPAGSLKADELRRGILFQRVGASFTDLQGCVDLNRPLLDRLADTAKRLKPDKENLFAAVTYDRDAWEQVVRALEQWQRRARASTAGSVSQAGEAST